MEVIEKIKQRAKANLKTIVLPEFQDQRIIEAASIIEKEGIAKVVLLTEDKIELRLKERYIEEFYELRKAKGIDMDSVRKTFQDPLYYAAMMTRDGKVDGFVAGASHTSA
ncbi:MAG: phosphate acyltransferase, partial [Candidatus Omnitrophota bacterium]